MHGQDALEMRAVCSAVITLSVLCFNVQVPLWNSIPYLGDWPTSFWRFQGLLWLRIMSNALNWASLKSSKDFPAFRELWYPLCIFVLSNPTDIGGQLFRLKLQVWLKLSQSSSVNLGKAVMYCVPYDKAYVLQIEQKEGKISSIVWLMIYIMHMCCHWYWTILIKCI